MSKLQLFFEDESLPALAETEFEWGSSAKVIRSVRGKTSGAFNNSGTFQWSPAVKALATLVVTSKLNQINSHKYPPYIKGERGSLAVSLDYAISKQPLWLAEMFGCDSSGICNIRRIIRRSNPERKRAGPVILAFNTNLLSFENIQIIWVDTLIKREEDLASLLHKISSTSLNEETNRNLVNDRKPIAIKSSNSEYEPNNLFNIFKIDTQKHLTSANIFSRTGFNSLLKSINQHPVIKRALGRTALFGDKEIELSINNLLGLIENTSNRPLNFGSEKLRIGMIPFHSTAAAIFKRFQSLNQNETELIFRWPNSTNLVSDILNFPTNNLPHIFTLNLGAAAWLIKKRSLHDFKPLMLMPGFSHTVMVPYKRVKKNSKLESGVYHFMNEIPSSSTIFFEDLKSHGILKSSKCSIQETDLQEAGECLNSGEEEMRVISPFPLQYFYSLLFKAVPINLGEVGNESGRTILFARRDVIEKTDYIQRIISALRDIWLEMATNNLTLEHSLALLLSDTSYMKSVLRVVSPFASESIWYRKAA